MSFRHARVFGHILQRGSLERFFCKRFLLGISSSDIVLHQVYKV